MSISLLESQAFELKWKAQKKLSISYLADIAKTGVIAEVVRSL